MKEGSEGGNGVEGRKGRWKMERKGLEKVPNY